MIDPVALHPEAWSALQGRRTRLPHALLLTGQAGLGKFALAQAFVADLLCESPQVDGRACGRCLACGWQAQGNHPDYRLLRPEAMGDESAEEGSEPVKEGKARPSQQIKIEQIRALDDFLVVGTHRAGLRIILVYPAEAMNRSTGNALLKSLEEPSANTLFLLVSSDSSRLLPTIRSRCQQVPVAVPPPDRSLAALRQAGIQEAEDWLALAGGSPLLAYDLARAGIGGWLEDLAGRLASGDRLDPLLAAAALDKSLKDDKEKSSLKLVVEWSLKWSVDLLLARNHLPVRYFARHAATITAIAAGVTEIRLLGFYRWLLECRREVEQPLNARLFLEEFFLNYRALFAN